MSAKEYTLQKVTLPVGVYYAQGTHSAHRDSLIARTAIEADAVIVSYENFCKAMGLPVGNEASDTAFRGAVEALLEAGKPVIVRDVTELDNADIALYGFDGPSQMKELSASIEESR